MPIAALPPSVTELFDDTVGRFVMNISAPAEFEVSAELASRVVGASHRAPP